MCGKYIKEEYVALRAEILQLNSQAFTLVGGSLTLNFTILGFGLGKYKLMDFNPLIPFIGIVVLVATNILIAHKTKNGSPSCLLSEMFHRTENARNKLGKILF